MSSICGKYRKNSRSSQYFSDIKNHERFFFLFLRQYRIRYKMSSTNLAHMNQNKVCSRLFLVPFLCTLRMRLKITHRTKIIESYQKCLHERSFCSDVSSSSTNQPINTVRDARLLNYFVPNYK